MSRPVRALVPPGRWPSRATPAERTLPEIWARRWAERPHQAVLLDGWDPAQRVDAGALEERTARLAAVLAARGAVRGARVLWSARATLASVETLLAVLRTGAVLVPLSPSARAGELAHVVSDAAPVLAVCDDTRPEGFGPGVLGAHVDDLAQQSTITPRGSLPAPDPGDDALIVYTSGTTGRPKGAVHTHRSLLAGVSSLLSAWDWQPSDRLLLSLPLFHVHGLGAGLFGTLTAGASALVFDRFDEGAVLDAATDPGSTMFFGVPTMYHRLAASGRVRDLAGLRVCVSGSAPLSPDLWRQLSSSGVEVLERYGMSETLLTVSNPLEGERRAGSVGVPLPGVEAAVDEPDGDGVGELLVRAASVCRGYWGLGPLPLDDGWFATGDLVSVATDGYVTVRGRRTELIITGGHNVYPAEVEAVLARHPGVAEVAVVGVPSDEWGETVVAFVVGDLDPEELRAFATEELAPFKCPRAVHVVESLPRNALGKVVRSQLG